MLQKMRAKNAEFMRFGSRPPRKQKRKVGLSGGFSSLESFWQGHSFYGFSNDREMAVLQFCRLILILALGVGATQPAIFSNGPIRPCCKPPAVPTTNRLTMGHCHHGKPGLAQSPDGVELMVGKTGPWRFERSGRKPSQVFGNRSGFGQCRILCEYIGDGEP